MQLDAATYDQRSPGPITSDFRRSGPALGATATNVDLAHARNLKTGTLFRRSRIGIDGTAFGDWDYRLLFDFGGAAGGVENAGSIFETWVQYNGLKPARIRVGAFAPSLGLDDQGSTSFMPFLERAISSDLARNLAGGDTRIGLQVFGYGDHWLAAGAVTGRTVAVLNVGTATPVPQTFGDQLGLTGRLVGTPFYGKDWLIHAGVHGSYVVRPANATGPNILGTTPVTSKFVTFADQPEIRVDATRLINTGAIPVRHASTIGGEFAAQWRSLILLAEYEHFGLDRSDGIPDPQFDGYYITGTWFLTGEKRKYNNQTAAFDAPTVAHPFTFHRGGLGAWELAMRYSDMDLNYRAGSPGALQTGASIRGGEARDFTAGINWYPNSVARVMVDYQNVHIERLSPANSALAASTIWFTPIGASIGQDYNVWSVRTQFAF
jgi:phosphate-selective porin OprO/OprP